MRKKDFENGCFSGDWAEFEAPKTLTSQQRKDLCTLLLELEDIKKDFERIVEHKDRLTNMMQFYNGELAPEGVN